VVELVVMSPGSCTEPNRLLFDVCAVARTFRYASEVESATGCCLRVSRIDRPSRHRTGRRRSTELLWALILSRGGRHVEVAGKPVGQLTITDAASLRREGTWIVCELLELSSSRDVPLLALRSSPVFSNLV
jgi:hypothetical protein